MAQYKYVAFDETSKRTTGTSIAADHIDLTRKLLQQGLYVSSYKEIEAQERHGYKFKKNELSEFSREIGTMLSSGVAVIRGIDIMLHRDVKPAQREIYEALIKSLQRGNQLSTAMEEQGGAFPELIINMFRAGEESGQLDQSAMKMAEYYEKEYRLQKKISGAMFYPIVLICMLVAVMLGVFTIVLPAFFDLFVGFDLPMITQIVIGISNLLVNDWIFLLLGVLIVSGGLSAIVKLPKVALAIDEKKLKVIVLGKLMKIIYTARFARTLSSLYVSGLSIIEAINISADIIGNRYIKAQFKDVRFFLLNGGALSAAISRIDGFDIKLASTILIGEETGKLDSMLNSIADTFDYEAEIATAKMVSLLEPIFIVVMAVFVGTVVISVLLPILTLYQNIG